MLGFGSATNPANTARTIAETLGDSPPIRTKGPSPDLPDNFPAVVVNDTIPPPVKSRIGKRVTRDLSVKRGAGDVQSAGFKLDEAGNVVEDAVQQKALKAGLDEGIVAQMAQSSDADKTQIGKMLNIVQRGIRNKTFGDFNLPRAVLGDAIYGRYQAVRAVNKSAGKTLGETVKRLKNVAFNGDQYSDNVVREFFTDLDDLGVKVSRDGKVNYKGSVFEGSPRARKVYY